MTSEAKNILLGAHVSTAGGVASAPARGGEIGATAIQIFTKTPNQWAEPVLNDEKIAQFKSEVRRHKIRVVVSHDSYLINLASPDSNLRAKSMDSFKQELGRCSALGIRYVVTHPGNFMDDRDAGMLRNAKAYADCLEAVKGPMILIETTAGSGTALGATFEELAELRRLIPGRLRRRVGYCADTCHIYAAGYDIVNDWDGVWAEWDKKIGLRHLRCLHLNDSKTPFGSFKDRHEWIAEGTLGAIPFRKVMQDERFWGIIKVIETPKKDDAVKHDPEDVAPIASVRPAEKVAEVKVNAPKSIQIRRMQFKSSARMLCATIVPLTLLAQPDVVSAQTQNADSVARAQALAFAIDSTDEGPHIYWQADTTAIVIYMCEGELISQRGNATDSLRFSGLCSDSTTRYSIPVPPPTVEPHLFEGASRIFTVSDLHGEYEALVDLFRNAGVVDDDLRWDWGDGHLVVLGDVFDRGDRVTECLWLIHRLEREAKLAGGRVHYLFGNHEKMVIRGDLRYVHEKYMSGIARRTRITYDDMFGPGMELGRWLRTKHVAVKINDILFVHGGLPPEAVERELSLDGMNKAARSSLDMESYELVFSDLPWFLFSSGGPLWYRGYHGQRSEYPATTSEELDTILEYYDVDAIVVGHSEISEVTSLHQGRVFAVDVPVEELGGLQGLLWKDGKFFRVLRTAELEQLNGH